MLQRALTVSGGSSSAEFITPTISGQDFSCSWNYDAEVVIAFATLGNVPIIMMYDMNKDLWYANTTTNKWTHYGVDNRVTISKNSFSGNFGQSIANMSVIPISNKPSGYYS